VWRKEHFGTRVDPIFKLEEKAPLYHEHGVDIKTAKEADGGGWAVLVVTPLMKRVQETDAAKNIVFIDSTSSVDDSQSTTTVLLAATKAGAIPLAVVIHCSQSTQGYSTAFGLVKQNYPLCFGGASAPGAFMTDNSAAEKAALQATWPEGTQLLCHFHVAQAEWRWIMANVEQDKRRRL
ncbi:unnamed protein product, partial [Ixodes hexagonus]